MPVDQHLFALFLITALVAMISPGPDMLFILGVQAIRHRGQERLETAGLLAGRIGDWLARRQAARHSEPGPAAVARRVRRRAAGRPGSARSPAGPGDGMSCRHPTA